MIELDEYQIDAVNKLRNGNILCGRTGSGKSRVALAYYLFKVCRGALPCNGYSESHEMENPKDLYIITPPKKRNDGDWIKECAPFSISTCKETNLSKVSLTIDSWNNIKKYRNVYGAFFIFDEQRLKGSGVWVKAFLDISRKNKWILLSATPGDKWLDYVPVFIANGYFRNITEFIAKHAILNPYITKYKAITGYFNEGTLIKYRAEIVVNMPVKPKTIPHHEYVHVDYDPDLYSVVWKKRWNPYENEPIKQPSELLYLLRKVVNSNGSRLDAIGNKLDLHGKVLIFYNFNYERDSIIEWLCVNKPEVTIAEWNGRKHEDIPDCEKWVYLVQYAAAEGWNCITSNTIIFFSENYSYTAMSQACGRIDRRNTPFVDLYYYHLCSDAPIDKAIALAIHKKRDFNEALFLSKN